MAFPAWLDKRKGGERGNSFNERASELIHGIHLQRDANYGLYGSIVTDVRQHALQIIINRAILAHRLIAPIIRSKIPDLSTRVKEERMRRRVASSMMDRNPRGNGVSPPEFLGEGNARPTVAENRVVGRKMRESRDSSATSDRFSAFRKLCGVDGTRHDLLSRQPRPPFSPPPRLRPVPMATHLSSL